MDYSEPISASVRGAAVFAQELPGLPALHVPAGGEPQLSGRAALTPLRARRVLFGAWLTRSRRVMLALAAVWVVSAFDLGFTLSERDRPTFEELNPLAAPLLGAPVHVIAAFKFALVTVGSVILLAFRRHGLAEGGCWFLLAAKVYVALRWYVYFECLSQT